MILSSSQKLKLLDNLKKARLRRDCKMVMPDEACQAVGTHLLGMLAHEYYAYLIALIKEDIEGE